MEEKNNDFNNDEFDIKTLNESLFKFQPPKREMAEIKDFIKPYSYWRSVFEKLYKNVFFLISFSILLLMIILAISVSTTTSETYYNKTYELAGPSLSHIFGIGNNNEDFWTTIWRGTLTTILFGFIIISIRMIAGTILGALWGYRLLNDIMMKWITNVFSFIPRTILWMLICFFLIINEKEITLWVIAITVGISSWVNVAQSINYKIKNIVNSNLHSASIAIGTSRAKMFLKQILPSILPIIFNYIALAFPEIVAIDSTLSLFNLSFASNNSGYTSLGYILNDSLLNSNWEMFPHLIVIPITMIVFNATFFYYTAHAISRSLDARYH